MPASFIPTSAEYFRILPEIILTLAGVLIMFLEAVLGRQEDASSLRSPSSASPPRWSPPSPPTAPGTAFHDMLIIDAFATFFRVLVIGVGILAVFMQLPNICAAKITRAANSTP